MGSPISGILFETFLKDLENRYFDKIIINHNTKLLACYEDNIVIIFNNSITNE